MNLTLKTLSLFVTLILCSLATALGQESESGKLFEGPDVTLYYEVRGAKSGTPLFVINGGPGVDHTYMHSTLQPASALNQLARKRPVIFYDQRGLGKSPALKPGQSCTVADQVADLDALRAHLGYDRINVLGHSYGGFLAMAYATRFPERIVNLILSNSMAPKVLDTIFLFSQVYPETNDRMEAIKVVDDATNRASTMEYLSMLFYSPEKRAAFLAKVTDARFNVQVNELILKDADKLDFWPELPKLRMPTLVITGRFDMNIAPVISYKMHQAIPNSKFVVFEKSGHLPFYEEQNGFVRLVESFLTQK